MAVKRQIVRGAASLAALYAGVAGALGLGEIQLESALNQPLNAIIELQGSEGLGPDDVIVRLAQTSDFDNAGIDKPYFLNDLRFTPVVQNRRLTVQVRSNQPVREPYLNFLVELRRPSGRMLREYTVLLDPPLYSAGQSAPVERAPVAAAPSAPAAASPSPVPRRQVVLPNLTPQPDADQYTTVAGDSLWAIAERSRPAASVSVQATMTAIHALNQQAFVGGDINRLKVGQALVLPTAGQLGVSVSPAPASEAAPQAAPESTPAPSAAPAGDSTPPQIADEMIDDAAESMAAQGQSDAGQGQGRLTIDEDAVSDAEAEAAMLASRLNELEGRFNTLLSELDSRDRQIAALQAELDVLHAARQAEEAAASQGQAGGTLGSGNGGDTVSPTGSDDPQAGSVAVEQPVASEKADSSFAWWSVLLALLAFLIGWVVARVRGKPAGKPVVASPRQMTSDVTRAEPRSSVAPAAAGVTAAAVADEAQDNVSGIELYITYGRFAEARDALAKAISEEPENLELRYKQARVLGELGDAEGFTEQAAAISQLGGDMQRVDQLRARFPQLDAAVSPIDTVDDVLDTEQADNDLAESQLNLNDFTLDPDWDLIEGLTPTPARKTSRLDPVALDDEAFESSLHEFPEIEELDDLDGPHDLVRSPSDEQDKR
ncbi:LysM peptidoglycan-binding domain-containing protein [Halopseudomonas aestusnigri]|uniref:type IV pilus assembly protein FimV n=1 Tax=Halopseudomonas aestusnigri TaxID=857252 RepID=UPI001E35B946|nr:FimV/HubP family polar landmark protein [Halopseudomonas aestusnigri]UGV32072.1 LysM peptidoglycan-binding domain-containing protein [Halopseudomonas aestusnigri]